MVAIGCILLGMLTSLVIADILFVLDYAFNLYKVSKGSCDWKKVREEGDFDVYAKKPWYSNKPFELYVLREKGETIHHKGVEKEVKKDEKKCFVE